MTTTPRALLLDVDGTLVDSTYVHVWTWHRALAEAGAPVPFVEVHHRIGKDGSTLVDELLDLAGVDDDEDRERVASRAKDLHSEYYAEATLRLLPGGRDLIRGAKERGWIVVLATSAAPSEFEQARELLDVDDHVDAVTTGEDVDQAKPDPTIVAIALERSGVDAADAIMVGDATWDAIAAGKLGIRSVAVRTGGIGDAELREAGFSAIADDAAGVLDLLTSGAL
ncbi:MULTISPECIES: HAD family hydrolase [unclassified Dietzia]|uniref:HAD family hydrolase n=1 Tax=unclassified Dietzia TaxID=2617939 RepID=UPI000D22BC77|nr:MULTISPECIES: HAD family hydrolase [unclassified Dietzia]AVZ38981.1 HAD family hydrolase [Dietzia sp. JS16-p6b]MBB1024884.1 HAD family hydrolase [Dietzia sp. DQ12-76]MBB1028480.1 HAD family hydrolase [Dietzia sp. DQ11-38-2]QGW24137.1 hydrolase [Dietzia sp. DQ12-45-1b]